MIQRPELRDDLQLVIVPGEGGILISEYEELVCCGPVHERLLPLLDGRSSREEIIEALGPNVAEMSVRYALVELEKEGWIRESRSALPGDAGVGDQPGEADPAYSGAVESPSTEADRIPTVAVRCVGRVDEAALRSHLRARGVLIADTADLEITFTDSYLRSELEAINRAAVSSLRTWLLVRAAGSTPWIGPLFVPGATACWHCLFDRLVRNRPVERYLLHRTGETPFSTPPGHAERVVDLVARELRAGGEVGGLHPLAGTVVTCDTVGERRHAHPVTRRPRCPACSERARSATACRPRGARSGARLSWPLAATAPVNPPLSNPDRDGGEHLKRLVDPITGVVRRVRRLDEGRPEWLHAYAAEYGGRPVDGSLVALRNSLKYGLGKGGGDKQARVSAIGEAVERYCAVFQGDEERRTASLDGLGEDAIHPNDCMLFSHRQYERRGTWNRRCGPFNRVPRPFDRAREIEWTPLWSLTRSRTVSLPTAYLYDDYPDPKARAMCPFDPNGNAAAESLHEAILKGMLELVERDAVGIWWYNRVRRPRVQFDSVEGAGGEELAERYASIDRELWVLDVTTDLGIPCVVAVSRRVGLPLERVLFGFGAHLRPEVAVARAVHELNQVLAAVWDLQKRGRSLGPHLDVWIHTASVADHPHLLPASGPATRFADPSDPPLEDVSWNMRLCRDAIEAHGLEILVLDQTRTDVGVPVVKVSIPGLRHMYARFAAGRLYEVPVRSGWSRRRRTEAQLNPVPMFL